LLGSSERIRCLWDHIDHLIPSLREKGLHEGIAVKVNYNDLTGAAYTTEWRIAAKCFGHLLSLPGLECPFPILGYYKIQGAHPGQLLRHESYGLPIRLPDRSALRSRRGHADRHGSDDIGDRAVDDGGARLVIYG
jgi:hypothetical protein